MLQNNIDVVIAYVDNTDINWQNQLSVCIQQPNEYDNFQEVRSERFRSYGTLPVLTKLIRSKMKFVDNIYVIVALESQIPDELKNSDVKFILHNEIIPEQFLPVFNSQTIEMFIHRIPNLKEHFIYFNDDIFPIKELNITDFFYDNKPVTHLRRWSFQNIHTQFRRVCFNSFLVANESAGNITDINNLLFPYHSVSPMFKSDCDELYEKNKATIFKSISKFRQQFNMNQYLYSIYSCLKRGYIDQSGVFDYTWLTHILNSANYLLKEQQAKIICINDKGSQISDDDFGIYKEKLILTLESLV